MKATIHIECTPAEARACFGWPDVQPMQAAMMEQVQERMLSEMDRFSPEALVNQWLATLPQQVEALASRVGDRQPGWLFRHTSNCAGVDQSVKRVGQSPVV